MGLFYFNYTYLLYMLPAFVISLWAQMRVKATFNRYSQVTNFRHMTGSEAAYRVLQHGGAMGVSLQMISGSLTDNFNPNTNTISLSQDVYNASTISAVGVAAHEAGHAVQYAKGYFPIKVRAALVPVTQIGSQLSMPLIFLGLLLPARFNFLVSWGIVLYSLVVLFQLVTLPVEFNASARALRALDETGTLSPEELKGAERVLKAAAMTYLAAMFTSLMSLLYLLTISGNRRED